MNLNVFKISPGDEVPKHIGFAPRFFDFKATGCVYPKAPHDYA